MAGLTEKLLQTTSVNYNTPQILIGVSDLYRLSSVHWDETAADRSWSANTDFGTLRRTKEQFLIGI